MEAKKQQELNEELICECWSTLDDSVDRAAELIAKGAQVNFQDDRLRSPLSSACEAGNVRIATLLLDNGASDNRALFSVMWGFEDGQKTPPHMLDLIRLLIERGYDVNFKDMRGKTALYMAIQRDCLDTVENLLANGARLDGCKYPALFGDRAVSRGRWLFGPDMMRLLLESGADPEASDEDGVPLVERLVEGGERNVELLEVLLEHQRDFLPSYKGDGKDDDDDDDEDDEGDEKDDDDDDGKEKDNDDDGKGDKKDDDYDDGDEVTSSRID